LINKAKGLEKTSKNIDNIINLQVESKKKIRNFSIGLQSTRIIVKIEKIHHNYPIPINKELMINKREEKVWKETLFPLFPFKNIYPRLINQKKIQILIKRTSMIIFGSCQT